MRLAKPRVACTMAVFPFLEKTVLPARRRAIDVMSIREVRYWRW
jgi:hypothetical protein